MDIMFVVCIAANIGVILTVKETYFPRIIARSAGGRRSKMKKIILITLMIILLLTLCSCNRMMNETDLKPDENEVERTRFIKIESYGNGSIVMDSETNVEYWMSEGAYNNGTLTMLVETNGNPKVRKHEY